MEGHSLGITMAEKWKLANLPLFSASTIFVAKKFSKDTAVY